MLGVSPQRRLRVGSDLALILFRTLRSNTFGLAVFLIPFGIRAVPEIIAGPYPIGYDTITAYVPYMYDWAAGDTARQFNPLIGGWLTFAIFGVLHSSTGVSPILITKVVAPTLYGILGISEYVFARRVLFWEQKKAFLFVAIASFYFVSLRLSWDLFRNTLGMVFLLVAFTVGRQIKSTKVALVYSGLVFLVTLTHLLMAAVILAVELLQAVFRKRVDWLRGISLVPGITLFLTSLIGFQEDGFAIFEPSNHPSLWILGYSVYIFLPLLPLVIIGVRQLRFPIASYWLGICLAAIVLQLSPVGLSSRLVWPDRWAISMTLPLVMFATEGVCRLRTAGVRWPRVSGKISYFWLGLIFILAVSYVGLPVNEALPYYRFFGPMTMLQSTVPLEDSRDVVGSFGWLSSNILPASVIVAHDSIYGWARQYFSGNTSILRVESGFSLEDALTIGLQSSYSRIYTVWWANGAGWYGEPTVPNGFVLQHRQGDFGVFLYSK